MRSRSLPKERPRGRYLTPVVESADECVSDGEELSSSYVRGLQHSARRGAAVPGAGDGKTVLAGGSFCETFDDAAAVNSWWGFVRMFVCVCVCVRALSLIHI